MLFKHFRDSINFFCVVSHYNFVEEICPLLFSFLCLNVVEVFWDPKLLVKVGDGDGGKLAPDPRVNGEDVVRPPVGALNRRRYLLLHLVEHLRVVVFVLLYLRLESGLLGLQIVEFCQRLVN